MAVRPAAAVAAAAMPAAVVVTGAVAMATAVAAATARAAAVEIVAPEHAAGKIAAMAVAMRSRRAVPGVVVVAARMVLGLRAEG